MTATDTLDNLTAADLVATINAIMADACKVSEADARPLYEGAFAGVVRLEALTGADLTYAKNSISTARSLHFVPGAPATHARHVAGVLADIA